MAVLVFFCLMLICLSIVGIGRMYLIRVLQGNMIASADEVARIAAAVGQSDSPDNWLLGMNVSAIANSTGNQIFLSDSEGQITLCSERLPNCRHIGMTVQKSLTDRINDKTEFGLTDLGGIFEEARYVVARGIYSEADGSKLGNVFVISPPDKIYGDWSAFLMITAIVVIGVLVVFLLATLAYSKRMARPLDEIAAASRKFS